MPELQHVNAPVGVYDSGVGGLSVLQAMRRLLPREHLIYVADSAYVPYGEKSRHKVIERSLTVAAYFMSRGVKALVVPCNTATAAAIHVLRERHPHLPIIGIEPAVRPAARLTRQNVIGVFATTGTLNSARFHALVQREAPHARIIVRPCPDWVRAVEEGITSGEPAIELVRPAISEVLGEGADVLVLGCTHFPFLIDAIRAVAPSSVPVLETSEAVARQVQRQLEERGLLRTEGEGCWEFHSSGDPRQLEEVGSRVLNAPIRAQRLPAAYC